MEANNEEGGLFAVESFEVLLEPHQLRVMGHCALLVVIGLVGIGVCRGNRQLHGAHRDAKEHASWHRG